MAQRTPVKVSLEWFEVSRAALVGVTRHVEALKRGCREQRAMAREWDSHILGALGECAFAKATNRYWNGSVNTFKRGADVGDVQVRTRTNNSHDLIVRGDDRDGDVFVLVTGGPHEFLVHGWISGRDAKSDGWKANYGGYGEAYFVPQSCLLEISELGTEASL